MAWATEKTLRNKLLERVTTAGGRNAFGREVGLSGAFVGRVLIGGRIPPSIARVLGYRERPPTFEPLPAAGEAAE